MAKIAVIGASAMGSALCRPLIDTGWDVSLWGTEFDDAVLDTYAAGKPHPATKAPLAPHVRTFRSRQLEAAIRGSEVLAICVASVGLPAITKRLAPYFDRVRAVWLTTKGFVETSEGQILLLAEAMSKIAAAEGATLPPVLSIGGPVIARQCALSEPTATVFACDDLGAAVHYARAVRTDYYRAFPTDDVAGIEVLAPLKNVYAIALGVTEGVQEATGAPQSNLRAAVFAQALREMSLVCEAMGGRKETAIGLAGVGDLEVTGVSGRNKFFGMRLGRGEHPRDAEAQMRAAGHTVEGVPTTPLALKLVEQRVPDLLEQLPLLQAVAAAVAGEVDIRTVLVNAALPAYPAEEQIKAYAGTWSREWKPTGSHLPWRISRIFRRFHRK
ncbi:glycerol-3-phosphate dehydrogenase [NAD(P)+] [Mobiluncus mulieris 28-1]|uniref:NAD(P)H-dependent glycerol-3-phosphate dehydrogenase n=1 Tax=Mobiluncus mulieris TaxID=2052 RepID=UPI0001BE7DFE|nr:NAD(P)H-dependent glycerol-3-phosphate dehydrogenase [Mobiluncus mulieris]EEZ92289.1 glycerol-3-phosphate dehydrogenase [NAD(P)+] [Mobiluncus mulieris 28-1]MCU9997014.1 glycerol-3-phosphate dehydrogenase [Mobiluncus mulieris]MCV0014117.1 glycerol-3-phosphate dehydrogenase [Mobiluncus mulieris]PNL42933.1 glycerol-3-phosphate dehydrogenase [Mobiluncus mulieris]